MAADFLSIWKETRDHVSIGGARCVKALVSTSTLENELGIGGFDHRRTLTVRLLRKSLSEPPSVGALLQYAGDTYRIQSVEQKTALPFIVLICQEE